MNTELFIARKVFTQKGDKKGIASRIVSIAVASISIGLIVMILSIAILFGYKKEVREKVIGFGSHFQIVNYDPNQSFETHPISIDSVLISKISGVSGVTHLSQFATKPGIIKTEKAIHPLVLKGVCHQYDWSFFKHNLVKGAIPNINKDSLCREVLVSEKQARLLGLKVGGALYCYFYNEGETSPRNRKFIISGIYRTSLGEFDNMFVLGDLKHIQQLNAWHTNQISGYEITIDNFSKLDMLDDQLNDLLLNNASEAAMLKAVSITSKYQMLFDWLSVLDMNVWVLLILMVAVAGINMISGLLVIILERSRMIGILKAMGFPNFSIRKVFMYLTAFLSLRGLFWGNVIGIGLCVFQLATGIFKLDPVSYYLETVPIYLNFFYILLLNIGALLVIVSMIIVPSIYISKISPMESIRFE